MSIFDEGTVAFWLEHPHQDWQTNASDYRFGPFIFSQVGFAVGVVKHPDKRLDVTIAGPFQKTTTFETRIPDVTPYPNLHVAITWQRPKLNLFLAGRQVSEWTIEETTDSSARATLPIVIRGADPTPPQETVEQVLDQLWNVFSTIEAFLIASDLKSLENALQLGLERPKFRVQESYVGSWKAILAGTHRAFAFAKDKLGAFFAVLAGKGERLAEAYVQEKEAAATHATEKARQEQIETLSRAMALANKLGQQLAESRQDFPGDRKGVLIQQFLISPMEQMAHILLENGLTLDVSSKSADTGATGAQVE